MKPNFCAVKKKEENMLKYSNYSLKNLYYSKNFKINSIEFRLLFSKWKFKIYRLLLWWRTQQYITSRDCFNLLRRPPIVGLPSRLFAHSQPITPFHQVIFKNLYNCWLHTFTIASTRLGITKQEEKLSLSLFLFLRFFFRLFLPRFSSFSFWAHNFILAGFQPVISISQYV